MGKEWMSEDWKPSDGTYWKAGDRVYSRWNPEDIGTILSVELSMQKYHRATEVIAPTYPVEWCKIRFDSGNLQEHAGHELLRVEKQ